MEDIRDAVSRLKRARIIAVAADLFYDYGFGNTTMDAVAKKLNVTKPFIYAHFGSKSELLTEIFSGGIRASLDVLNRVVASDEAATDKVHALVRDFMLTVLQNQKNIAIYTRERKHLSLKDAEAINAMRREFDNTFHALLQEVVAAGEFVVDDTQLASLAIGGIVSWSYVWYRPNGRLTSRQTATGSLNWFWQCSGQGGLAQARADPGFRCRLKPRRRARHVQSRSSKSVSSSRTVIMASCPGLISTVFIPLT